LIATFGGSPGIAGSFQVLISIPLFIEKSAIFGFSCIKNQFPLWIGNKRVGHAAMEV